MEQFCFEAGNYVCGGHLEHHLDGYVKGGFHGKVVIDLIQRRMLWSGRWSFGSVNKRAPMNKRERRKGTSSRNAFPFFLSAIATYFLKLFVQMDTIAVSSIVVMALQMPRAVLCSTSASSL